MDTQRLSRSLLVMLAGGAMLVQSNAAPLDIAQVPLTTSAPSAVLPNLLFILDDSDSMLRDFMPGWANDELCRSSGATSTHSGQFNLRCEKEPPYRSASFNSAYYNPAIRYLPPLYADGSSWPVQNAANTSNWSAVKDDAYGVQSTAVTNLVSGYSDVEYCTDTTYADCLRNGNYVLPGTVNGKAYVNRRVTTASGTGFIAIGAPDAAAPQAQTFGPHYYRINPAEFCDDLDFRNCQNLQTSTYKHPATLRWCRTNAASRAATPPLGSCQALKTPNFNFLRIPTKYAVTGSAGAPAAAGAIPGTFSRVDIVPATTSYPRAATRSDCVATAGQCSYEEEMTNFANWFTYYRTRLQLLKSSASLAFSQLSDQYRVGYLSINNATGSDFLNLESFDLQQRQRLFAKLNSASTGFSTPLRGALTTAGRLYAGRLNGTVLNGSTVVEPNQYSCQQNFALLSTDGYWIENGNPAKRLDGTTDIGDADGSLPRPLYDGTATPNTLADVAAYYYETDLRTGTSATGLCRSAKGADLCENNVPSAGVDVAAHQHMTTFTLGLGVSGYMQFDEEYSTATRGDFYSVKQGVAANPKGGVCSWQPAGSVCNWPVPVTNSETTIDDLWHAAVNGRGSYFSATDPANLYTGLSDALAAIAARRGAAAAAMTSNPNIAAGDDSVFISYYDSGQDEWTGELLGKKLSTTTGDLLKSPSDWSAASRLSANGSRNILTFSSSSPSRLKTFAWSDLTAGERVWFESAHITSAGRGLSQFCGVGPTCLSPAAQTAAAGKSLVDFLRGDRTNEGPDSDNSKYFRPRKSLLGDIVNSEALYVKKALFNYADPGYSAFKAGTASRRAMVYVGANDGMLHAFDAATGDEVWAYVPTMVMPNLYRLADKNYGAKHMYFVDGSPVAGDIQIGSQWRTIVVGGLGAGGRGYYALDVTNPASPTALWEFTHNNLGLTFGKAEITKLKDGTWVVLVPSGYNNINPGDGRGRLYVINAATGALIRTIDTPAGSTTAPSGLAQIRAWVDRTDVNNTTLRVYGGDNLGNLWRFDVNGDIGAPGHDAQLLATLTGRFANVQPVSARPELGVVEGHAVVFVGTGRYLGVSDMTDTTSQSIYAIKDSLNASGWGNPRTQGTFVQQTLSNGTCPPSASAVCSPTEQVRIGSANAVNFSINGGWFIDLPLNGERADTDPQLALGTLSFTTNIPETSACKTGGSSYLNFLDYRTGGPVGPSEGVGSVLLGNAGATRVNVAGLAGGKLVGITQLKDGRVVVRNIPVNPPLAATRRISYRELVN